MLKNSSSVVGFKWKNKSMLLGFFFIATWSSYLLVYTQKIQCKSTMLFILTTCNFYFSGHSTL